MVFTFLIVSLSFVLAHPPTCHQDINLVGQLLLKPHLTHSKLIQFTRYTPSLIEYLAGAGVVAYSLMAFTIGVRYLRVVDHPNGLESMPEPRMMEVGIGAD